MAIPMLPLVLVGVGVFVFSRRKRVAKKKGETKAPFVIQTAVFIPPSDREPTVSSGSSNEPGQHCDGEGGYGAWDELGECKTFWIDGETDDAIRKLAREEWEARGRPSFSQLCLAVDDPTDGEFTPQKENPLFVAIVSSALQRYYGVGPLFPPKVASGFDDPTSPYWVHRVWAVANAVVSKELCDP